MQTPPINRKRGTIDLTRSDSEDEAPKRRLKRRRRVIEIESDDDDDEAPVPKKTLPWETPEWQAHCAKVREENAPIDDIMETFYASSRIHQVHIRESDEEIWRKIHDPVGAKRMELTRSVQGLGWTGPSATDYIEREVAKFSRKRNGPCPCVREGLDNCISQCARHACACRSFDNYELSRCRAATHGCICHRLDNYELSFCKATKHGCICHTLDNYELSYCKAKKHRCICRSLESYERSYCKACN